MNRLNEDLLIKKQEVERVLPCPLCKRDAKRHSRGKKILKTLVGRMLVVYSKHYCVFCTKHFTNPAVAKYGPANGGSSWEFIRKAVEFAQDMTLEAASLKIRKLTGNELSPTTLHDWIAKGDELFVDMPGRDCEEKED